MAPRGLAIVIGSGSDNGLSIARILSNPNMGNLAVALISRNPGALQPIRAKIVKENPGSVIETYHAQHTSSSLQEAFEDVRKHPSLKSLPLALSIFTISSGSRKLFEDPAFQSYRESLPFNKRSAVYIYERTSLQSAKGEDKWQLIGSFVSARRAAVFLDMTTAEVQKHERSGTIYKERYKFASK